MTIGTDAAIDFFGTPDTVTIGTGTSAVTNTSFSASGDVVSGGWANDDDAPLAIMVLTFQRASGTLSDGIHLYLRLLNIDGTTDEPQPDSSYKHHYVGTFVPDPNQANATDTSYALGPFRLPNVYTSQTYEFYIENQCGQTMTAGWTLKITPITLGPHG